MKKLIYMIFIILTFSSCFKKLETIDANDYEEKIKIYDKNYISGTCYTDETGFIFLSYDSTNTYISKIDTSGFFSNIFNLNTLISDTIDYKNIKIKNMLLCIDNSKIITWFLNDTILNITKITNNNQLSWSIIKIYNDEKRYYNYINCYQSENQNIVLNFKKEGIINQTMPPIFNVNFKQEEFDYTTGTFLDSTVYLLENQQYAKSLIGKNEIILCTGKMLNTNSSSEINNINISFIKNKTIKTLQTNLSAIAGFYNIISKNNNYYTVYMDEINDYLLIFNSNEIVENKKLTNYLYPDKLIYAEDCYYLLSFSENPDYYPYFTKFNYNNDSLLTYKSNISSGEIIGILNKEKNKFLFFGIKYLYPQEILFSFKIDSI